MMRLLCIRRVYLTMALALLVAVVSLLLLGRWLERQSAGALSPLLFQQVIMVDAGHGGADPGVVGVSGCLEKDIDLSIAQKLSELLRAGGACVTMTRERDTMLGSGKPGDLAARAQIAAAVEPAAFISIHGNSFPSQPSAQGAQTFFFSGNEQGRLLAQAIQQALTQDTGTSRVALAHKSAFILKHIAAPAVVVEVGFLSNSAEEALLKEEDYQWRLAWAIYSGILDYLAISEVISQKTDAG
jgi:N-acetylmuramoyl-L-alanine amidase